MVVLITQRKEGSLPELCTFIQRFETMTLVIIFTGNFLVPEVALVVYLDFLRTVE